MRVWSSDMYIRIRYSNMYITPYDCYNPAKQPLILSQDMKTYLKDKYPESINNIEWSGTKS